MYIYIYIDIYIYIARWETVGNVHYLYLTGWIYVFYIGHTDKIMKPFSML
jgi:hypothetical protein